MKSRPLTLEEYRAEIKKNAPWVDRKSHSHNIISLALLAISEKFGRDEANKAIDDYKLERLGWQKE